MTSIGTGSTVPAASDVTPRNGGARQTDVTPVPAIRRLATSGLRLILLSVPGQTAGFPPQRLRETLTGARTVGLSWPTAWKVGRQAALKGLRTQDRNEWAVALNGTMPAWRAAYLREPRHGQGWSLEPPTAD